ncbi:hypothetical protein HJG54_31015 [Leptolyngbya sp. NK1-12]|uniref:Uncharacterized protein n=1 Tax=Leptolyngbya sp. NK1-12 TaxID=2547451 RepID=A0AA96WMB5_9CYAN|nr:hypothetical protein [Leptolyngbya sp. NK1-12]WNZ27320.1 hypothetical protein HJG54_31015 [Leptolyngbya sp. NK1-12]
MNSVLNIKEIAIAIVADSFNPLLLTADFLKYGGIIPADWELSRQPVLSAMASQVVFQSGVSILAQANRLLFVEALVATDPKEVTLATIAQKYTHALPQANYQAVGINFTGFANLMGETVHHYLTNTLLAPGPWHSFGETAPRATFRLSYTLKQAQLNLDIAEVNWQISEREEQPAILFAANFDHLLQNSTPSGRLQELNQAIDRWPTYLETYHNLVNSRFLQPERAVSPV